MIHLLLIALIVLYLLQSYELHKWQQLADDWLSLYKNHISQEQKQLEFYQECVQHEKERPARIAHWNKIADEARAKAEADKSNGGS